MVRTLAPAAVVVLLALAPYSDLSVGGLLPGAVNSTGSLQLLALMFVAAATAITLDLMFGYTGLLSFGHALYFGFGCYSTVILSNIGGLGFTLGLPLAMLLTFTVALVGNAASLRLTGIGFSMATLALAQALSIAVERGFLRSGGEVGVTYGLDVLPAPFVGIVNTRNTYWLALALLVAVYALVGFAVRTEAGHVWQAIRENPLRTGVLGYNVYASQLASGTIACTLAGACGAVYSIVMGGANPSIVVLGYSLSLVLMVVLGGRGVIWGAVVGGFVYTYLNERLTAVSDSGAVSALPHVIRAPLSQPNFILGTVFVLVILFLPGGLASLFRTRSHDPVDAPQPRKSVLVGDTEQGA
ncbi:branched-chain amino acid ABC transporter permease [Actinomadura darangshiensis]|uniref:Branched-chain amino acid ABC transporter permease n=1 Tax=Actinomadura darangshiensis TaxID=705336 RepID=A0A4R5BMU5_9ACTN|nr:branched-chain amino acid ABC transporter permease [Actinomadura darangshiensis]TDD87169.1 branched-chain amino acid ABC transporter permease [Actinomadura darangshiensis]